MTPRPCCDLTDVTLADEGINSKQTNDVLKHMGGRGCMSNDVFTMCKNKSVLVEDSFTGTDVN